jgi:hypothetical protein
VALELLAAGAPDAAGVDGDGADDEGADDVGADDEVAADRVAAGNPLLRVEHPAAGKATKAAATPPRIHSFLRIE